MTHFNFFKPLILLLAFTFLGAVPVLTQQLCCCTGGGTPLCVAFGFGDCDSWCTLATGTPNAGSSTPYADAAACAANCGATVPVNFTDFSGKATANSHASLQWATTNELNNEGFEVQRADGLKWQWEPIAFVVGQGTTNDAVSYHYTDKQPMRGTNYYRLHQIDYDDTEAYSDIIAVKINKTEGLVDLYPSMARDRVALSYQADPSTPPVLHIYDMMGRLVYQGVDESRVVDISNLPIGHYVMTISLEGQTVTERFARVN